jgi:hypothetical protein
MRSELRFVMHPEDENSLLRALLTDPSVLLIDGPRWKGAKPEATRDLSSIGSYCIVWSPDDLSELSADFIPTCNDWYCRSEHSTIQFLRSTLTGAVLTEGRLAVATDTAQPRTASSVERRYRMLHRVIEKTYANAVVEWRNTSCRPHLRDRRDPRIRVSQTPRCGLGPRRWSGCVPIRRGASSRLSTVQSKAP